MATKEQLAKDFHFCCGYCGDAHYYTGGIKSYHIDHFAPKSKFIELQYSYENFVYSCPYCNFSKSNKWVGKTAQENVVGNTGFIDPCSNEYSKHLGRNDDGSIIYKTELGKFIYNELRLYLERHKILFQLEELKDKINLIKLKIKEFNNIGKDTTKLTQMHSLLCEAFFYYFNFYCEDLDTL